MERLLTPELKKYSEDFISSVRQLIPIEEVIADYVTLQNRGGSLVGLCPFHTEKSPSFHVSPSKRVYHCFGCKKGGDAFSFLIEKDGLAFPQAVRALCERFGISQPSEHAQSETQEESERQLVLKINAHAMQFWVENLSRSETGKAYLEARGVDRETADRFKVGFASDSWDQLKSHLTDLKFTYEQMRLSGLFAQNGSGSIYDRFRNRLIFPIFDQTGQVVAFGGRDLSGADKAKYINSPETAAYRKGAHLFALRQARDHIRSRGFVIVTEGYMDAISLHQHGVENTVAALGTAFTDQQAALLKRFTDRSVICFDSDLSGINAAEKAAIKLINNDLTVKVMTLVGEKDPDEFLKHHGKREFELARSKASTWFEFRLNRTLQNYDLTDPKQKTKAAQEALKAVSAFTDEIERREYFLKTMSRLQIDESLHERLWRKLSSAKIETVELEPTTTVDFSKSELLSIVAALDEGERAKKVEELKSGMREDVWLAQLLDALVDQHLDGEYLDDFQLQLLREAVIKGDEMRSEGSDLEKRLNFCVKAIQRERLESKLSEISNRLVSLDFENPEWRNQAIQLDEEQARLCLELRSLRV